jgi:uncharacterized protein (TIGR03382 family)
MRSGGPTGSFAVALWIALAFAARRRHRPDDWFDGLE